MSGFVVQIKAIVKTFPHWPAHPCIYTFFENVKLQLRREILKVEDRLETFSEYVTYVKKVENNKAASSLERPSKLAYIHPHARFALPDQIPQPIPLHLQLVPIEIDGTRGQILKLQPGELQRRKDGGLCSYCGLAGHVLKNCPRGVLRVLSL